MGQLGQAPGVLDLHRWLQWAEAHFPSGHLPAWPHTSTTAGPHPFLRAVITTVGLWGIWLRTPHFPLTGSFPGSQAPFCPQPQPQSRSSSPARAPLWPSCRCWAQRTLPLGSHGPSPFPQGLLGARRSPVNQHLLRQRGVQAELFHVKPGGGMERTHQHGQRTDGQMGEPGLPDTEGGLGQGPRGAGARPCAHFLEEPGPLDAPEAAWRPWQCGHMRPAPTPAGRGDPPRGRHAGWAPACSQASCRTAGLGAPTALLCTETVPGPV